jgi:AcrR family transcriptional regulator
MPASDRSYPSVWARPRRKERSTLTREQIVAEALRLLDTEGIDALSMRKLGAGLGAGAASLYWHVANRDELLELVVDEIYGELDVPDADDAAKTHDWRATTRRFAHSQRSAIVRHRWVASVLDHMVGAYLGPNISQATERMLAVFESAGFELPEAERALSAVAAYVTGAALGEASWHNWLARRGQTPQEWLEDSMSVAEETTEGHERVRTVAASYEGKDWRQAMDEEFEYGLERVLDGIQSRLDALT